MHYLRASSRQMVAYFLLLTNDSRPLTNYEALLNTLKTYHSTRPIACSGIYASSQVNTYGLIYGIAAGSTELLVDVVIGTESYRSQSLSKELTTINDTVLKIILS